MIRKKHTQISNFLNEKCSHGTKRVNQPQSVLGLSDARVSPLPILYAVSNCTSTPELKIDVAVLTLVNL